MMNFRPQPITILHVFGCMNRGGAEMRTLEVMRRLDRNKYRFWFCSLSGLPGELDQEIRLLGGEVFYLPLRKGFSANLVKLLRSGEIDAVHSHVHFFSGYILRVASASGIPVRIAHFRNTNDGGGSLRKVAQNLLMRYWIGRHATHILAVCKGAMAAAWGRNWERDPRCRVIYNGFDISIFAASPERLEVRREFCLPDDAKICIHVGRMAEAKNHQRLLKIFQQIAIREPFAQLLLVGRGGNEVENALRSNIEQSGLGDRIHMAGERADVPRLLQAADLLIFPSKWEGLPGAVIEACAAGLPVLASILPGTEEIASHFPHLVQLLSLEKDDREWCERAISLLAGRKNRTTEGVADRFQHGAFSMDRCLAQLDEVWSHNGISRVIAPT
jgi:glycosyltransferase involved in cell wall biosynthesis